MDTEDGDLGEGPETLIWTVCDLCSSFWIAEVNKEDFLPFRLRIIKDHEDDLRFTLTGLKRHHAGLHAEVFVLLGEGFGSVQSKRRSCRGSVWKKVHSECLGKGQRSQESRRKKASAHLRMLGP